MPAFVTDVNEFAAAAEALSVNIAELRWLCQQDGSMWLDAARVIRLAQSRATELKRGAVTVVGD